MRQRSARACTLRIKVSTDGFLSLENFLAGAISDRKLHVARLAARAHADHHPLGRITRTPASDGSIERVDCAVRSAGRFVDDGEVFAQLHFQFGDELRLHQFHVVWELNPLRDGERLDDQNPLLLRPHTNGGHRQCDDDGYKSLHSSSSSTTSAYTTVRAGASTQGELRIAEW